MKFLSYCVALTRWGYKALPAPAFEETKFSWAVLIESDQDEEIFGRFRSDLSWVIRSAHRKGYGKKI